MRLFTIGFTKRTAESFFEDLRRAGVRRVLDIRLNASGQLAGFAKERDLPYLLERLVGATYEHDIRLAPTDDLLKAYMATTGQRKSADNRPGITWPEYETQFRGLMRERRITEVLPRDTFESPTALLCSEETPERCHRRLVAEILATEWPEIEIVHL